jgi:thiamine biosynthesis protein ThiS
MIRVNDKWDLAWQPGMTIADVLAARQFTHRHIVVSLNGVLIPPEQYLTQTLSDGDRVTVVHVIGGG